MGRISKGSYSGGFALPTVLIASVVMMIVLLAGLVATSSTSVSLRNQVYDQIAQEAAEAGISMMVGCLQNSEVPTTGTFTPQATTCMDSAVNSGKSRYIADTTSASNSTRYRSSYVASTPVASGNYYLINVRGYVDIFRTSATTLRDSNDSSPTAATTITKNLSLRIQYSSLVASESSSGDRFVCGIVTQKAVCWGKNTEGELGGASYDPTEAYEWGDVPETDTEGRNKPIKVDVLRTGSNGLKAQELKITAGGGFACAITTTNDLSALTERVPVCWGTNKFGELGRGLSESSVVYQPTRTSVPWGSGSPIRHAVDIQSGYNFVCALTSYTVSDARSNVWCWGRNNLGQMGNDTQGGIQSSPGQVLDRLGDPTPNTVQMTQIALTNSARHICGLNTGGHVLCWGNNTYGQVGDNTTASPKTRPVGVLRADNNAFLQASMVAVGGVTNESDPSDNAAHTCAVGSLAGATELGKIWCWGRSAHYETTSTSSTPQLRATKINSIGGSTTYTARLIAAANKSVCAVVRVTSGANEQLYCWGSNMVGELGTGGAQANFSTPQAVAFPSNKTIDKLTGGAFRFCAISGGSNYCWGQDQTGQTGDGVIGNGKPGAAYRTYEATPVRSAFLQPPFEGVSY